MSYEKLVMCVDNSGSMSGPKIMNSINYLNQIAQSFNISTIYFRFGNKVDEVGSYSQSTLPCNDGTKIENCLNDLFNNHLRRFSGSKTKFIFVTDAEDRVKLPLCLGLYLCLVSYAHIRKIYAFIITCKSI